MTQKAPAAYDQQIDNQHRALQPSDISVAIMYPGNRVKKMSVPLKASGMEVDIEPSDGYERDIVVADNADRDLGKEVLRNKITDSTLVYRMRGDVFHELDLWEMHWVKKQIATKFVLRNVDGCIAVTDRLAQRFKDKTGLKAVGSAGLWKRPDDWPTIEHSDTQLKIVTLTNMNYWQKVEPITEWAVTVENILEETGGHWHICGKGTHSDRLSRQLNRYDHVSYEGYVDAKDELAQSNLMLHPTNLDGQPNSVLEGLASGMPVVTNDWIEFLQFDGPVDVAHNTRRLLKRLQHYTDPVNRAKSGTEAIEYIAGSHSPDAIARDYERYFTRLIND